MELHQRDHVLLERLEAVLAGPRRDISELGEYPYIAYNNERFFSLLMLAWGVYCALHPSTRRAVTNPTGTKVKFIDVGCGIGSKVLLAQEALGWSCQAWGLEKSPGYIETAKKLLGGGDRLIQADALHYDGYGQFDLVYFYKPIADDERQQELEERIISQVRSRTVIVSPLCSWMLPKSKKLRHVIGASHGSTHDNIFVVK